MAVVPVLKDLGVLPRPLVIFLVTSSVKVAKAVARVAGVVSC